MGTYTGSIVISVFGGSSVTVAVTLTVSSIQVAPASLTFKSSVGNTPLVQSVTFGRANHYLHGERHHQRGQLAGCCPPSGLISGYSAVTAIPDPTIVPTLARGIYTGTITITPTSGTSLDAGHRTGDFDDHAGSRRQRESFRDEPAISDQRRQQHPASTMTLSTTGSQPVAFTASATNQPTPIGGTWVRSARQADRSPPPERSSRSPTTPPRISPPAPGKARSR